MWPKAGALSPLEASRGSALKDAFTGLACLCPFVLGRFCLTVRLTGQARWPRPSDSLQWVLYAPRRDETQRAKWKCWCQPRVRLRLVPHLDPPLPALQPQVKEPLLH